MAHKEPKIEVRVYLSPDEHEYLKAVAKENNMSMTELLRTCTLKKCKYTKKRASQKISVPSTAKETAATPEPDTKDMEKRLVEVNTRLNRAYKGDKLPIEEYNALKEEQAKLRAILGHN